MEIEEILRIANGEGIRCEQDGKEVKVFVERNLELRIYPQTKTAEFLEIDYEWDELKHAVRNRYSKHPEMVVLTDLLNAGGYEIIW